MLYEYVSDLAMKKRILDIKVTVKTELSSGPADDCTLTIEAKGKQVSEYVRQSDIQALQKGHRVSGDGTLETKINTALDRLKKLISP